MKFIFRKDWCVYVDKTTGLKVEKEEGEMWTQLQAIKKIINKREKTF